MMSRVDEAMKSTLWNLWIYLVSCEVLFQISFSRERVVGEFHPVRSGCWPRQPKNEPGPHSDREVCVHAIWCPALYSCDGLGSVGGGSTSTSLTLLKGGFGLMHRQAARGAGSIWRLDAGGNLPSLILTNHLNWMKFPAANKIPAKDTAPLAARRWNKNDIAIIAVSREVSSFYTLNNNNESNNMKVS